MTTRPSTPGDTMHCAEFEDRLPAWLECQLEDGERTVMERHRADCVACATLVADLDGILQSARTLPVLTPSRDLWSGIEARLDASVIPLAPRREPAVPVSRRNAPGMRMFAVAATVLVAVTSGLTWTIARARFSGPAETPVVAAAPVPSAGSASTAMPGAGNDVGNAAPAASSAASSPRAASVVASASGTATGAAASTTAGNRTGSGARVLPVSTSRDGGSSSTDVDAIYERQIAALRHIVNERFASLDSGTVRELRRNLDTIDQAIADSRRALERDPRSGLLSSELDRTLEAKLALMRRVALL